MSNNINIPWAISNCAIATHLILYFRWIRKFCIWECIVRRNSLKDKVMATSAKRHKQFEKCLLEAVNQAELSWGMYACLWRLFPQPCLWCACSFMATCTGNLLCSLLKQYIMGLQHVCWYGASQWKYGTILYSAAAGYIIMSLASSGN